MQNSIPIINQVFEIQTKLNDLSETTPFERNLNRLFAIFEEEGYVVKNPIHEPYQESRTDCEASIVGNINSKMKITKVLKPIIYQKIGAQMQLVQKAIVIVE
ncbi:MAG: hypothetical protein JNL95_08740 [Chitinophagales bacterium]|nr:hypothetical protein [Chitinophagales bacterium]